MSVTALKRWVRLSREGQPEGGAKQDDPVDPAKHKALEARLRELERENDFLKKVSSFFAKEQRWGTCTELFRRRTPTSRWPGCAVSLISQGHVLSVAGCRGNPDPAPPPGADRSGEDRLTVWCTRNWPPPASRFR
jgi:hypothetical protein